MAHPTQTLTGIGRCNPFPAEKLDCHAIFPPLGSRASLEPMTRLFIVLAGSCLLGACAAPKAELAEETPPTPAAAKPGKPPAEDIPVTDPASGMPGGLRLPPGFMDRLPEDKDFQATSTPGSQGGAPVISAPPTPAE